MTFPMVMPFHARHDKVSFTRETLEHLAAFPAVVLDWNDEARIGWAPDGLTPGAYLRKLNPEQRQFAYIPAAYWWAERSMSPAAAPHRVAVQTRLGDNHWLRDASNKLIQPWPGQPLLSPVGIEVLQDYLLEHFDPSRWAGIHFDVLTPELLHLGVSAEQSRACVAAMVEMLRRVRERFPGLLILGNGSWEPFPDDLSLPYSWLIDGAMVERFPTYPAYTPDRKAYPVPEQRIGWHLQLARRWLEMGALWYHLHDDGLHEAEWWRQHVKTVWQGRRLVLAASCILGCWYTPPMRSGLAWTDEMAVAGGQTTMRREGVGWLGAPVEEPPALGQVLLRQFEHGLVVANVGQTPQTVAVGPGWRRIIGWFDKAVNNGQPAADAVLLSPYDALFLLRDGAPLPTPQPPSPSPSPEQSAAAVVRASLELARAEKAAQAAYNEYMLALKRWHELLNEFEV